jgi:hypothetical protein
MTGHLIQEDGCRWLRIVPPDGFEWDEPVEGWHLVIHLFEGHAQWKHSDGRTIRDQP